MASERKAVKYHDRLVRFLRNCMCHNLSDPAPIVDSDGRCDDCAEISCPHARALLAEIEVDKL